MHPRSKRRSARRDFGNRCSGPSTPVRGSPWRRPCQDGARSIIVTADSTNSSAPAPSQNRDFRVNTVAKTVSLRNDSKEDSDPIDSLLEERGRIIAELERLSAIDAPVRAAEDAVAAIDRAIATLDTEERSNSEAWATSGVGEPPEPRNAERAGLVKRRIELQSDVDSARNQSRRRRAAPDSLERRDSPN